MGNNKPMPNMNNMTNITFDNLDINFANQNQPQNMNLMNNINKPQNNHNMNANINTNYINNAQPEKEEEEEKEEILRKFKNINDNGPMKTHNLKPFDTHYNKVLF